MKGIFIAKYGKSHDSFKLEDIEKVQLKPNEVYIEVSSFGLNYADIMARQGLYKEAPPIPFVPGYEVLGTVVEVGVEMQQWLGKSVLAFTRFGGYASHCIAQSHGVFEVDDVKNLEYLALATQYVTAYYATNYVQPIRENETVLIQAAAGGVGMAIHQMAKLSGARTVGLVSSEDKKSYCLAQGFDAVYSYQENSVYDQLKNDFPNGFDAIFNSLAGKSFKEEKKLLNFGGRMVLFGGSARSGMKGGTLASLKMVWQMGLIIPIGFMMGSKNLIGINMLKIADYKPIVINDCLKNVLQLYKDGRVKPVISVFSSKNIVEAHELLESRKSIGKIVCKWED